MRGGPVILNRCKKCGALPNRPCKKIDGSIRKFVHDERYMMRKGVYKSKDYSLLKSGKHIDVIYPGYTL